MTTALTIKDAPLITFHKIVYLCFILGQIACGYTLAIAGTALTAAAGPLHLNSFWMAILGAGTLIGLGLSFIVGNIVDRVGRKTLFLVDMWVFGILALLQYFINDPITLFIVRVLLGITIAVDYTTGAALLTEWLPIKWSSKAQASLIIWWTLGFTGSYFVGSFIGNSGDMTWKYIFMTSAGPALLAAVVRAFCRIPESAEWLGSIGQTDKAMALIHKYVGEQYTLPPREDTSESKAKISELFTKENRINSFVAGVFYGCQVFPYFGVGIFIPIVVKSLQLEIDGGLVAAAYNIFVFAGSIIGVILFEKISRRAFIVWTFYIAVAGILLMIVGQSISAVVVIGFLIFAMSMAISVVSENPYPPELFNTRLRGTGIGFSIFCSRVGAALGTFMLPIVTESFGVFVTLGICGIVLLFGGIFCQKYAPETSPRFMHKDNSSTSGGVSISA